jgi:membrane-associated phospholipid phosphatase
VVKTIECCLIMRRLFLLLLFLVPVVSYSQNIDIRLLRLMNSPEVLPSDDFFRFVSNSEVYIALAIPAGLTTAALIEHNDDLLRDAIVTLAAAAFTSGITQAIKYSVNRERPFITYPDITKKARGGSPSFPSGHTSSAFAAATSFSLVYPRWYVIVPAFIWAGTVGFSRLYLGVHYPSDVLMGAVIGSGTAYLTHIINKKLVAKKHPGQ